MIPLIDQKRAYLRAAVDTLKGKGVIQKEIAERMGESDGAFSGRLGGQRGIPDDYIDRFSEEFKIPYAFGQGMAAPGGGMSQEQADEILAEQRITRRMLDVLLKKQGL